MYGESIVMVKKIDVEIFVELSVLRSPESKKVVYKKCLSVWVCVCVCVCVCTCATPIVDTPSCTQPGSGYVKNSGYLHTYPQFFTISLGCWRNNKSNERQYPQSDLVQVCYNWVFYQTVDTYSCTYSGARAEISATALAAVQCCRVERLDISTQRQREKSPSGRLGSFSLRG